MVTTITTKDLTWAVGVVGQTCVDSDMELEEDDLFADKYVSQYGIFDAVDDIDDHTETDDEEVCVDSDTEIDQDDLFADNYVSKSRLSNTVQGKDDEHRVLEEIDMDRESDDEDLFADKYFLSQGGTLRNNDQQGTHSETDGGEATSIETGMGNNSAALQGQKECGFCRRKRPLAEFHRANSVSMLRSRSSVSCSGASFRYCISCRAYEVKARKGIKTPGVCRYCSKPMPKNGRRVTCKQCGPMITAAHKATTRNYSAVNYKRCAIPQCDRRVSRLGACCDDHTAITSRGREGRAALGYCKLCIEPFVPGTTMCEWHLQREKQRLKEKQRRANQRGR